MPSLSAVMVTTTVDTPAGMLISLVFVPLVETYPPVVHSTVPDGVATLILSGIR